MTLFALGEIEPRLDPRIEVLAIVQWLAGLGEEAGWSWTDCPYVDSVRHMFKDAREHPAPALLQRLRRGGTSWSFDGAAPVRWTLHLSYPEFDCQIPPTPELVARAGGRPHLKEVSRALHHFVQDSLYREFRARHRVYYERSEMELVDLLQPWQCMGEVESVLGRRSSYRLAMCPLYPPEPWTVELHTSSEQWYIVVLGPTELGEQGELRLDETTILHGILHPLTHLMLRRYFRQEGAALMELKPPEDHPEEPGWRTDLTEALARVVLALILDRRGASSAGRTLEARGSPRELALMQVMRPILEERAEEEGLVRLLPECQERLLEALGAGEE